MLKSQNKALLFIIALPVVSLSLLFIAIIIFDGRIEYVPVVAFQTIFHSNLLGNACIYGIGLTSTMGTILLLFIPYEDINIGKYLKRASITLLLCFICFFSIIGIDRIFNDDTSQEYKSYQPKDTLLWKDSIHSYEDECIAVEGPVVSGTYASNSISLPTFLDIGEKYPSNQRVSIVIWGEFRHNFKRDGIVPETYYIGKTIRVVGYVNYYKGAYQIEVTDPGQIEIL